MSLADRNTETIGDEAPRHRSCQARDHRRERQRGRVYKPPPNRQRYSGARESTEEIEAASYEDSRTWGQYPRSHRRGDGVRRVSEAPDKGVDVCEDDGQREDEPVSCPIVSPGR